MIVHTAPHIDRKTELERNPSPGTQGYKSEGGQWADTPTP